MRLHVAGSLYAFIVPNEISNAADNNGCTICDLEHRYKNIIDSSWTAILFVAFFWQVFVISIKEHTFTFHFVPLSFLIFAFSVSLFA